MGEKATTLEETMKDFLGQIMNENLEYHEGSLDFSGSEIELNLSKN